MVSNIFVILYVASGTSTPQRQPGTPTTPVQPKPMSKRVEALKEGGAASPSRLPQPQSVSPGRGGSSSSPSGGSPSQQAGGVSPKMLAKKLEALSTAAAREGGTGSSSESRGPQSDISFMTAPGGQGNDGRLPLFSSITLI